MDGRQEKDLLRKYLAQYKNAKRRKRTLSARMRRLKAEYASAGNGELQFKIAEIADRLKHQEELEVNTVLSVMDMIEFLPVGSTEREILELRHIDCRSWTEVERTVHLSHSSCNQRYNTALDAILAYKKARKILEKYARKTVREEKDGF